MCFPKEMLSEKLAGRRNRGGKVCVDQVQPGVWQMRPVPKQDTGTKKVSSLRKWRERGQGITYVCRGTSLWGRSEDCFAPRASLHLLNIKHMSKPLFQDVFIDYWADF